MPRKLNLADYEDDAPVSTSNQEKIAVPNKHPKVGGFPYRIAIIGEAPGGDEVYSGEPFVGMSGRFLSALLSKAGIARDACFVGNVCQYRPPANQISAFKLDGPEIVEGLERLAADLLVFNPSICILLGKTALWAANGQYNIGDWRGSIFTGDRGPFLGRKCIASYHPAACLRQYDWTPLLMFDLKKAKSNSSPSPFVPPLRNLIANGSADEIVERLNEIYEHKQKVSIDIEGYVDAMSCISFAVSSTESFIVPFSTRDGRNYWPDVHTESRVWLAMARVLEDSTIAKVLQNCLYDTFVLQYSYGICVRNIVDDTMVKHWELYCELEKGLGFLCSLYTNEPFYKQDRKSDDRRTFWEYCCRDSAVTYEISDRVQTYLDGGRLDHYRFNMQLLNVFRYMEIRGLKYNSDLAKQRLNQVNNAYYENQYELDTVSGFGIKGEHTRTELLAQLRDALCYKRDLLRPKKGNEEAYHDLSTKLLTGVPLNKSFLGHFNVECGTSLNLKSPNFKQYVYQTLGLPPQYKKDPTTGKENLSTDYTSLLKLSKKSDHPAIKLAIEIGILRTRSQMLQINCDPDGRIRCGYNEVGAATGRITCYTSPTGSGYNLQTLPDADSLKPVGHPLRDGMRDLVIADEGCYLGKNDLKGADGWTVGAHCAALGDRTMLDDLLYGIKPAAVLCYMMRHGHSSIIGKNREQLKHDLKEVKKDDWDYFCYKQWIWGFCYGLGPRKAVDLVLVQSEGKVVMAESDARDAKRLLFIRYNVPLWWEDVKRKLRQKKELTSASGHRRRFFGREQEILGEALAHEPQANTTYATNRAAWRLWHDPENRTRDMYRIERPVKSEDGYVCLRVEPVHQVHDELLTQFRRTDVDFYRTKIREWFDNPLFIAGLKITIPFEGVYGTNWSMDDKSKVGEVG